ncbi:MAG: C4-dicarboxylate ABC transporter, partial [Phenylobacterium sp.]|nr:C4-dicarboxylate ABC transporter [Phenylobacterium sp.]
MTATPPPPRSRSTRGRRALLIAGIVGGVLLILMATLYLNRRAATRQVLIGWLEQQGIEADMQVERLELDGLVARVRIGDADNPDVTVERVEVDYAIGAPWSKGGLGVTPTRIRLIRPVVRASVRDGKLTFGSLDPLVEGFAGRPPRPDSRGPLVLVEGGRVRLDT